MINIQLFGNNLQKIGYTFYTGVPCSFLKSLINYAVNKCEYVGAANEGDAVAIASGAMIGGRKSVVLMQNSGLSNAVSPLVSLNYPFQIPLLGFVSLRGEPGLSDEPQHELMGNMTTKLLDLMQIEWRYLASDNNEVQSQLLLANSYIERNKPFFFVVRKGTFSEEPLRTELSSPNFTPFKVNKNKPDEKPSRYEALTLINALKNEKTVQIATTGKTGRELYQIEDHNANLYMVGSMGCASSLGLGMALTRKNMDFIVIDGDGSLLMRMGSLATNGFYKPPNMLHIVLDNNTYDSTGGQSTVSDNVNFVQIAAASGYTKSIYIHNLEELKASIQEWKEAKQLTLLYMKISQGSKKGIGRPQIKPCEVKERLQRYINNPTSSM
ncbi:phosphonopyruvate decarboxylase [Aneurinibacillus sp. Ricciae_BoGa-3]|uniref:phosphonopyruvate decarboxylase n=1 Tax=Aneurinibacillus sp. Ricciae_BoGa-3 TaxID=3022697 RepID=UPI002341AF0F|nr:phosphonopyruvate decarboxylase [Aneurinibacillus sp. Ricciae_BoGa-3]WCK56808.1 phosphonopyruvate decarboxylase [Aneurinibacillus sp. Ricciae_BoGa-3]